MISGYASNGGGDPRQQGTARSRPAIPSRRSPTRDFLVYGIDDLAKYRIVGLLYDCPSLVGDAACYAAHLGFHSIEVTSALLEELVESGILTKEHVSSGKTYYLLVDDARVRLAPLYADSGTSAREPMLRLLAWRSLLRARRRAKKVGRDDALRRAKEEVDSTLDSASVQPVGLTWEVAD